MTMTTLTTADLAYLRSELGAVVDDADLQDRYDRLASTLGVALEVVRERLSTMLSKSASMTLTGVMSRDNSANIKALQDQATRLTAEYRAELATGGSSDLVGYGATSGHAGRFDRPR